MHVGTVISNVFAIVFFFIFIGAKFMNPGYLLKCGYFLLLYFIQLVFILFFSINGIAELAPLICCIALSLLINMKEKNYIKSFNIAFSILIMLLIIVYAIGTFVANYFPNFYSFEGVEYNAVMATCVFASAFILKRFFNFFINQIDDKTILIFHLMLKIFIFIFLGIVSSLIFEDVPGDTYHAILLIVVIILVIMFFIFKLNSKLIFKLEREKNMATIRNIEAENINKEYKTVIKLKHYYTGLYRSTIRFIESNDMAGMKEYYDEHITPISKNFTKELDDFEQIELIKISLIKSRLIELVNTVSLIPNAKLIININSVINSVTMKDKDLFAILNIYIENAVDEIREQKKGTIKIYIEKTHESVKFLICNSLIGYNSSPKLESNNRGMKIADEIMAAYSNVEPSAHTKFGWYEQYIGVFND